MQSMQYMQFKLFNMSYVPAMKFGIKD